ncbi:lymphocyte antigen 6E-like [Hyla sarda]|uniref:lymphocyte antigen 6E-like n=1 Tax=Hyla sarda TaxID=327740 RepID=UPI0024C2F17A|nr:lymphocyte antigen 6E-like [Hyla sarda]XP_056378892.1 lymphocyte antigen 6E-like [Hyla sarda]XP_056378893.1 lymphocyte antigen 6E-like [Hyla sarda]XP_056378894.1 lymphocyte antigen 6E-like [Hyla sarda]XP_056378895.1 lymphocyte antigen 6E-like [Hyla sarda]XP_056378896.1 lymphocyte antigen 6E-like [Hyla sarda]XP_056378897.1 lymphocyte antigen 6E-like [Hyla sarda]
MAAYTRILLGVILCATTVYSLKCYTCNLEFNNANCLTATNCSSNATSCQTELISVKGGSLTLTSITKTCAESCSASSTNFGPSTFTTSCCNTDLCNTSGGASITSSYTAIILALGSVLTILRSSML